MSIVTISRGSHSYGKEVAEKVAERLGYECIAREVLLEASEDYGVPEVKLAHAMQDAPSFLDRVKFQRERHVAYVQAALLQYFQRDNVVYHGQAGQFLVQNVPHVLKVRIVAEWEDRARLVMEREGIETEEEAIRYIKVLDKRRQSWSQYLYGIDTRDPRLYDLIIHIKKLSVDDAANLICRALELNHFHATPESQQAIEDLLLATRVKARLIDEFPRVHVNAQKDEVQVGLPGSGAREEERARALAETVSGVSNVRTIASPLVMPD